MGIILFNLAGYRLLNDLMQDQASLQMEARVDQQQIEESQLITIKIPATHLSYYNSSALFESIAGQIDIGGTPYQYVKRRIHNDTVELVCIANQAARLLQQSRLDYFKLINDLDRTQKPGNHPGFAKSFLADPYTVIQLFRLSDLYTTLVKCGYHFAVRIPSLRLPTAERPPDQTA